MIVKNAVLFMLKRYVDNREEDVMSMSIFGSNQNFFFPAKALHFRAGKTVNFRY